VLQLICYLLSRPLCFRPEREWPGRVCTDLLNRALARHTQQPSGRRGDQAVCDRTKLCTVRDYASPSISGVVLCGGPRVQLCIISEAFEELEKGIGRAIALSFRPGRCDGGQRSLLHGEISLDISVGRDWALMP